MGCKPGQSPREHNHKDLTQLDPTRIPEECLNDRCTNPVRKPSQRPENGHWRYSVYCGICTTAKKKFGLTGPERQDLLDSQDSKCLICESVITFNGFGNSNRECAVVDHDHKTQLVRGVLCGQCNVGLGNYADDIKRLRRAADYLERKHNERQR